jgi:hypothetical protein
MNNNMLSSKINTMQYAKEIDQTYQSILDPPPADPFAATHQEE